jgi:hypothetical protein
MGIRTPDLLHAMERRTVHHSPRQVTADCAELRIRSGQGTSVHESPLRTVTSLVTSPTTDPFAQKRECSIRPPSPAFSPSLTSLARDPARRQRPAGRLSEPPAAEMGTPTPPGTASSWPVPGGRQCTSGAADRTTGARAAARLVPLPWRDFPCRATLASKVPRRSRTRLADMRHHPMRPARAGRILRPGAARHCCQRSGRPA